MKKIILLIFIFIFQTSNCQDIKVNITINKQNLLPNQFYELELTLFFSNNKTIHLNSENDFSKEINLTEEVEKLVKIELEYEKVKYLITEDYQNLDKNLKNIIVNDIDKINEFKGLNIDIDKFPYSNPKTKELLKEINHENSIRKNEFGVLYINNSWMFMIPEYNVEKEVLMFVENEKISLCKCMRINLKEENFTQEKFNTVFHQCLDEKIKKMVKEMYYSYSTYFNKEELIENEKNDVFNSEIKLFLDTINNYLIHTCFKK